MSRAILSHPTACCCFYLPSIQMAHLTQTVAAPQKILDGRISLAPPIFFLFFVCPALIIIVISGMEPFFFLVLRLSPFKTTGLEGRCLPLREGIPMPSKKALHALPSCVPFRFIFFLTPTNHRRCITTFDTLCLPLPPLQWRKISPGPVLFTKQPPLSPFLSNNKVVHVRLLELRQLSHSVRGRDMD
ncbi:MAG: hypothetical protein JOS17DRAFT_428180 [Linnemannia elongata]|nr:MAG: hypothetical protein JOS17DRAFT_428180 [Linnemannia elongata]